jgi:hypothetical protein
MARDLTVLTYDANMEFPGCGENLSMTEYVDASVNGRERHGWRLLTETVPGVLFVANGDKQLRFSLQAIVGFTVAPPQPPQS